MNLVIKFFILATCMLGVNTSCKTTNVHTLNPNAEVFVDGQFQGAGGLVKIDRFGRNDSVEIKVADGVREKVLNIERSFTVFTFFATLYTYGIGYFFFWELPEDIYALIALDQPNQNTAKSWQTSPWQQRSPWRKQKISDESNSSDNAD